MLIGNPFALFLEVTTDLLCASRTRLYAHQMNNVVMGTVNPIELLNCIYLFY